MPKVVTQLLPGVGFEPTPVHCKCNALPVVPPRHLVLEYYSKLSIFSFPTFIDQCAMNISHFISAFSQQIWISKTSKNAEGAYDQKPVPMNVYSVLVGMSEKNSFKKIIDGSLHTLTELRS